MLSNLNCGIAHKNASLSISDILIQLILPLKLLQQAKSFKEKSKKLILSTFFFKKLVSHIQKRWRQYSQIYNARVQLLYHIWDRIFIDILTDEAKTGKKKYTDILYKCTR